jgi:tRNA-specific 2-thiouridylase
VEGYLEGTTPSPCVRCNRGIKIPELFRLADRLGAARVATGHYARIGEKGGRLRLLRARDDEKDQSYFLYSLDQKSLDRLLFPLGESEKPRVRAEALELGLFGAEKGESQELCFVPTGRYDDFVRRRAGDRVRPGAIVDDEGRSVGSHQGVIGFTVGQRKNLGVALGRRSYVVRLDAETATVHLGSRDALASSSAVLDEVVLAEGIELPRNADVSIRYRAPRVRARLTSVGGTVDVRFETSVSAVVPGQAAVFYDGDAVIGGGRIVGAARAPRRDAAPRPGDAP